MGYFYYPGCSLEGSARHYDESLRAVFRALDVPLTEVPDWNCCGATMYMSVEETAAVAVATRNLALVEREGGREVVAPCSACYAVLIKANTFLREQPELRSRVDTVLDASGLCYGGDVKVRHPLDVLVNDIGIESIARAATARLDGVRVAPYYGCQIVRPLRGFDDPECPTTMDRLFERLGASVTPFEMKTRCCGGMLMTTFSKVGIELARDLLDCATEGGADCVATTCPLCQINLEAYQPQVNRRFGTAYRLPVLFFTQLLGLALGCSERELGLHRNLVPFERHRVAVAS